MNFCFIVVKNITSVSVVLNDIQRSRSRVIFLTIILDLFVLQKTGIGKVALKSINLHI